EPAEMEPTEFHGAGAFDVETGALNGKSGEIPSFTKVFSEAIVELADKDKKIMAITAAMPEGTGLDKFRDKYPNRYFDVGIAEEHAITFAAGLAAEGLKPIVNIYSTFMQRAFDQIMHDVCLQKLPVIMVMDRGGIVGDDGPTHHGVFDMSFLRILPNLVFMAPSNENELRNALKTALTLNKPVAIRYPRGKGVGVKINSKFKSYKLGVGEWLKKGKDVNILAIGNRVYPALEAAKALKEKGIDAGVADMRFLKPLDSDLIKEALELSKKIVTVEDNALMGGFGSSILEWLNANALKADVFNMGIGDAYVEQGKPEQLYNDLGISPDKIAKRIQEWI
ncbi:MAG: 1-deoxy-D-xylulose-5-phosphate synthase, partial [Elusimicrobiales bacterium]|nr:1-deoxy-D-xylulose-5-phosphate synthase [Elusimicrobiales bacterium]